MQRLLRTACVALATSCFAVTANAALLFSDNFNRANTTNYDTTVPQDASQGGSLASAIEFRASKRALAITDNQLSMTWGGAVNNHARGRFHNQSVAGRYDFAPALAALGSSGSMTVSFDYNINAALNTPLPTGVTVNDRWVGFSFGTDDNTSGEPDIRVNNGTTDLGVIIKARGPVEYFNNGTLVSVPLTHSATGTAVPVSIRISYDGLLEGDNIIILESIKIGATEILPAPVVGFKWETNGVVPLNAIHLELENRNGANLIDNFAINAIGVPEPGSMILAMLSICAVAVIRSRRRGEVHVCKLTP